MKNYLIHYVQKTDQGEIDLYWRCAANSRESAIQSLHDCQKNVLFAEVLKAEE